MDRPEESNLPLARKRTLEESSDDLPIPSSSKLPRVSEPLVENVETEDKDRSPESQHSIRPADTPETGKKHQESQKRRGKGRKGRVEAPREPQLDEDGHLIPKALRYPKRMCALLIGFCGSGYNGMQIQPEGERTKHIKTIEGVLFNALVKIGAISQDNADNPTKVGLARAARTDAGVHAAGNLVSLKMILTIPGVDDIVARVNEELPPEIRLWGYARTQNSFNARTICESRKYTYYFPSYMLIPPRPGAGFTEKWCANGGDMKILPASSFWHDHILGSKEEDLARKRSWRIGSPQMETLRTFAGTYEGTHNFHNFTVGREFKDRSNMRYMKKIQIADPVVHGETEWISVLFHGQSFMLHQVRKMMSVLVLGARMGTSIRVLPELFGQRSVFVPKMPALGLLLEEPLFDSYNQRMTVINEKLKPTDADYRPPIDFEQYRDSIEAFKTRFIHKTMREVEDRDGLFDAWLRSVDAYSGSDLLYLSPSGAVPDNAVIVKGRQRDKPFRERRVFDTTSFTAQQEVRQQLEEDEEDLEDDSPLNKRQLEETEG
ncbi:pseudouridine synthase [Crepidotus variabilis]|uniref:Pseudouridine synthase n=1 Tax=Crepidotus variabilis TaxID=179855 RepID=A0A9P6EAK3_9AGAR|nr:pseudouridine synthase [Crepidotus variabilis]